MVGPSIFRRCSRLALIAAATAGGCWFAPTVHAQQKQESGLLDRINNPDRTLHYSPADKSFAGTSSVAGKEATVHAYTFSHPATLRAGNGVFNTSSYTDRKDKYRVDSYQTRGANEISRSFSQTDKQFGTQRFDVHDDRAAGKTAAVREYVPGEKPFLGRGKRQDSIDELRKQKNLTVDQVREILNKSK